MRLEEFLDILLSVLEGHLRRYSQTDAKYIKRSQFASLEEVTRLKGRNTLEQVTEPVTYCDGELKRDVTAAGPARTTMRAGKEPHGKVSQPETACLPALVHCGLPRA